MTEGGPPGPQSPARPRVLVSSCLLGDPVRYDGAGAACAHPVLARWSAEGRVIAFCPELAGGLPVPREPAEIAGGLDGRRVLQGLARVVERSGRDVTAAFIEGAVRALAAARDGAAALAVLKEGSPSCGSGCIHDGSFSGRRISMAGVTAACLRDAGIPVFSEHQLAEAEACLARISAAGTNEEPQGV